MKGTYKATMITMLFSDLHLIYFVRYLLGLKTISINENLNWFIAIQTNIANVIRSHYAIPMCSE